MSRIQPRLVWIVLATACLSLQGCSENPPFSYLGGGASTQSDGWWFSAGSVHLQSAEPGLAFGMQKTPTGDREFAYVVLFRHAISERSGFNQAQQAGVSFDGTIASMRHSLTIDEKVLKIELEIEAIQNSGTLSPQSLKVNGTDLDPLEGKIFLVDFTSDAMSYHQIDSELPESLRDPTRETKAVSQLARNVIEKLENENETVRNFLQR
jgi:hypothetical protein